MARKRNVILANNMAEFKELRSKYPNANVKLNMARYKQLRLPLEEDTNATSTTSD